MRLYESLGGRAEATVTPGFSSTHVEDVDLHEDPMDSGALSRHDSGAANLRLRPLQIVTLRFKVGQDA